MYLRLDKNEIKIDKSNPKQEKRDEKGIPYVLSDVEDNLVLEKDRVFNCFNNDSLGNGSYFTLYHESGFFRYSIRSEQIY